MAIQRAKLSTPSQRALKTELKTSVRLFVAFCLTKFIARQVVAISKSSPCDDYRLYPSPGWTSSSVDSCPEHNDVLWNGWNGFNTPTESQFCNR